MSILLIILSVLFWIGAIWALVRRIMIAPVMSFLGLLLFSLARPNGWPVIPISTELITIWLAMSLVVTFIIYLQPSPIRLQTRGMGYMIGGALAGLAVGLLGFLVSANLNLLYAIMIAGVLCGIFLGFLLYSKTPDGQPVAPGSGHFFKYLFAKGFPTAITIMQPGVVLVLLIGMKVLI